MNSAATPSTNTPNPLVCVHRVLDGWCLNCKEHTDTLDRRLEAWTEAEPLPEMTADDQRAAYREWAKAERAARATRDLTAAERRRYLDLAR